MGDEYSYGSLGDYINQMRDAAIESTMHLNGIGGTVSGGFDGGNPPVRVSPLGGHYEGSTMVQGGQITDPTGQYVATVTFGPEWPFHDLASMIAYYNTAIDQLFSDWWQMPQPGEFDGIVASARQAAHLLASDAQTAPGPGCSAFGANTGLANIATMNEYLSNFDGAAIRTFVANYGNRLPIVVAGQDACACMVWTAAAGEQQIWVKAQQSIANIAGKGLEAMKACDDGGGGGLEALLLVAGAAALIAAPFTEGGSLIALNAVGVVLQTSSTFLPEPEEKEVSLGGSNPIEVIGNIQGALDQLNDQITKEELGISKSMEKIDGLITGPDAESFNMSTPPILQDDQAADFRTEDDTRVRTKTLLWIADTVMPAVVTQLKGAIAGLEDAQKDGPWIRPGSIGLSSYGPYLDWNSMVATLRLAVVQSKNQLDLVSTHLVQVADDFDETDAQISAELEAHTREVDKTVYGAGS